MDIVASLGTYSWVLVPLGLFLGLLGYRLYKVSLFVIGLCLGFTLGHWIGLQIDDAQLGLILGGILGLAFGVGTHFLIRFSLFLAGMAGGLVLATTILPLTSVLEGSVEAMLWSLGSSLACGLLTLALYKILILAMTALLGTFLIYEVTFEYFPRETQSWGWALYVVLFAVFLFVQLGGRKDRPDPIEQERSRKANR
ncbi:MAG: DUF4203 domain-containing protein [Spirochaetales bacterium]|nr:DUF4203 domain-containing protein [Spirochaetales bacterium]